MTLREYAANFSKTVEKSVASGCWRSSDEVGTRETRMRWPWRRNAHGTEASSLVSVVAEPGVFMLSVLYPHDQTGRGPDT